MPVLDRMGTPLVHVLDKGRSQAPWFADLEAQRWHRPTRVSPEYRSEFLCVLGRGGGIHGHPDLLVALGHEPGSAGEDNHRLVAHIRAPDLAMVDMKHHDLRQRSRSPGPLSPEVVQGHTMSADAVLDVSAFQLACHRPLPSIGANWSLIVPCQSRACSGILIGSTVLPRQGPWGMAGKHRLLEGPGRSAGAVKLPYVRGGEE